jgi:hypothetical protein
MRFVRFGRFCPRCGGRMAACPTDDSMQKLLMEARKRSDTACMAATLLMALMGLLFGSIVVPSLLR